METLLDTGQMPVAFHCAFGPPGSQRGRGWGGWEVCVCGGGAGCRGVRDNEVGGYKKTGDIITQKLLRVAAKYARSQ